MKRNQAGMRDRIKVFMWIMAALLIFGTGCAMDGTRGDYAKPCPCKKRSVMFPVTMSVSEMVRDAGLYRNRDVYVRGRFMGWKGNCSGKPPETRRDWMLEQENACIYVSGPLPAGITNIRDKKAMGKTVRAHGRVLFDGNGVPYLKASGK